MHIGNDEDRERPAAVTQDLQFSSAHLHRDISHNNVVEHIHSSGCNYHVRVLFLERAGRVEVSDQSFARVVDEQLQPGSGKNQHAHLYDN